MSPREDSEKEQQPRRVLATQEMFCVSLGCSHIFPIVEEDSPQPDWSEACREVEGRAPDSREKEGVPLPGSSTHRDLDKSGASGRSGPQSATKLGKTKPENKRE